MGGILVKIDHKGYTSNNIRLSGKWSFAKSNNRFMGGMANYTITAFDCWIPPRSSHRAMHRSCHPAGYSILCVSVLCVPFRVSGQTTYQWRRSSYTC
mmetsp:Transcript_10800/g.16644  ORF Transcript_10800/g.16644 Transcript_10800/m.16644 type:complete len:97 (-) Transcript_10800:266-556(-)